MKIEVYDYSRDHRNGELSEIWTLNELGHAVCDDACELHRFEVVGAVGAHGHIYYPKDGEPFLRNLPGQFANSSFVRAKIIE